MQSPSSKDFPVIISWSSEDEVFIAFALTLNKCIAYGETMEEAAKNVTIAIDAWLKAAKEEGWEIPESGYILPA